MNPWTLARQYSFIDSILSIFGPRRPPLQTQLDSLRTMTFGNLDEARARLARLEATKDSMDAYYMKVLGSALKQHVDQRMDTQDTKLSVLEAKCFKGFVDNDNRIQGMREALARSDEELKRTNSRITQILKSLRNLGENNT